MSRISGAKQVYLTPDVYSTIESALPNFQGWQVATVDALANALLRESLRQRGFSLEVIVAEEPVEVEGVGEVVELVEAEELLVDRDGLPTRNCHSRSMRM